jgi:hypothetical protein
MRLAGLIERGMARLGKVRDLPKPPVGTPFPLPAPSLGMNTRVSVSALDPREARSIGNMICDTGRTVIRKGKTAHQTLTGASAVGMVFTHNGETQETLLAAGNGKIFNATGTPSQLATGYALDTWSAVQFNDTTVAVNGTDTPWAFNGTTIGASGLSGSGLTIANLRTVHKVGIRLWFTEKASADVWYGAPSAVTGVLTKFQLSQETKGGYCVGIYEFRNSTVFVMSTGEVVSYQGDVELDFAINGSYQASRPVGYDPGLTVGADLIIMTASGTLPFEAIAAGVTFDSQDLGAWGKISASWAADFARYGGLTGWNGFVYNGLALFNIPTDTGTSKQWVFNTKGKTWTYFDNLNASQFAQLGNTLYFGDRGSGGVFTNTGGTDNGAAIVAPIRAGFFVPYAGNDGVFSLARLNCKATGAVNARLQVDVNYGEAGISAPQVALSNAGSGPWDGPWDGPWGVDGVAQLRWTKIKGFGRAVAPVVEFSSSADTLEYFGTDIIGALAGSV